MSTVEKRVESFTDFLEGKVIDYRTSGNTVLIVTGLENIQLAKFAVTFDDGGASVHIAALGIARAPQERIERVVPVLNNLNRRFRWCKFFVDHDGDVIADCDALIYDDTANDTCLELIAHVASVIDDAYLDVMQSIYS